MCRPKRENPEPSSVAGIQERARKVLGVRRQAKRHASVREVAQIANLRYFPKERMASSEWDERNGRAINLTISVLELLVRKLCNWTGLHKNLRKPCRRRSALRGVTRTRKSMANIFCSP